MGLKAVRAEVNLFQLAKNINVVRNKIGKEVKLLFVVKGDGYGHGAIQVALTAERTGMVDWLGVDNVAEAKKLRDAGIRLPILVMGVSQKWQLKELVKLDLSIAVSDVEFAHSLNQASKSRHVRTPVHVNVDTGMGRAGVLPNEVIPFFRKLQKLPYLQVEGIFSHLSAAYSDNHTDEEYTLTQIAKFNGILHELAKTSMLPSLRHIANSGGLVRYFDEVTAGYYNMVRIGGLFYGHYTGLLKGWAQEIKPILTLTTEIAAIRDIPAGHYIGYERTYKTNSVRRIAVLPIGYGHGLDQRLSNCGKVMINGKEAPIVGLISMGQTMVDVTDIEDVRVGDKVEIIGPKLPASQLAQQVGIFSSALLVSISPAVERVYTDFS